MLGFRFQLPTIRTRRTVCWNRYKPSTEQVLIYPITGSRSLTFTLQAVQVPKARALLTYCSIANTVIMVVRLLPQSIRQLHTVSEMEVQGPVRDPRGRNAQSSRAGLRAAGRFTLTFGFYQLISALATQLPSMGEGRSC